MPTRHERATREKRLRALKIERRHSLEKSVLIVCAILAVGGLLAAIGLSTPSSPSVQADAGPTKAVCSPIQTFATQSRDHIAPNQPHPPYSTNPPTSGWHWATPQDWGIYTTPQVQEQLVHNLEHGGIVIQYNGLAAAEVQQLTNLVSADNHHMILAPYPGLPSGERVALTAWDHLQTCTGVDEPTIHAFINGLRDKGPELVP